MNPLCKKVGMPSTIGFQQNTKRFVNSSGVELNLKIQLNLKVELNLKIQLYLTAQLNLRIQLEKILTDYLITTLRSKPHFTLRRRTDVHTFSVFGHGTTGNINTFILQMLHNTIIRQRFFGVFCLNHLLDHRTDSGRRDTFPLITTDLT